MAADQSPGLDISGYSLLPTFWPGAHVFQVQLVVWIWKLTRGPSKKTMVFQDLPFRFHVNWRATTKPPVRLQTTNWWETDSCCGRGLPAEQILHLWDRVLGRGSRGFGPGSACHVALLPEHMWAVSRASRPGLRRKAKIAHRNVAGKSPKKLPSSVQVPARPSTSVRGLPGTPISCILHASDLRGSHRRFMKPASSPISLESRRVRAAFRYARKSCQ